jgi:hypothetical protein
MMYVFAMTADSPVMWYTIASVVGPAGVGTLIVPLTNGPGSPPSSYLVGGILTAAAVLAIIFGRFGIPSFLIDFARRRDPHAPISAEPRVQGQWLELLVTNKSKSSLALKASVTRVVPRPLSVSAHWRLPWPGTDDEAQEVDPGSGCVISLGKAEFWRNADGDPIGRISFKQLGGPGVIVNSDNPVTVGVRVTVVGRSVKLHRDYRITPESTSLSGEAPPRIEDVTTQKTTRPRRADQKIPRRMKAILAVVAAAALVGATLAWRHAPPSRYAPRTPLTIVHFAVGSENQMLFESAPMQNFFRENHLEVVVTGLGSRQMRELTAAQQAQYDVFLPSGELAAAELNQALGSHTQKPLIWSPLAIATFQPEAQCLESLKIASYVHGIWTLDVSAYIEAAEMGERWGACHNSDLPPPRERILLTTTDPECSNSGETFVALVSSVANGVALRACRARFCDVRHDEHRVSPAHRRIEHHRPL